MPTRPLTALLAGAVLLGLAGCASAPAASAPAASAPSEDAAEPTPTPTTDPASASLSGIVVLFDWGEAGHFEVGTIDPDTGATTVDRDFVYEPTEATPAINEWTPIFTRMSFDPEYRRVAATYTDPADNSRHVGWIGVDGTFTDVTLATSEPSSAFSGTVSQNAPVFDADGNFYFADLDTRKVMEVTSETPSTPADATPVEDFSDVSDDPSGLAVFPSGTIEPTYAGGITTVENLTPGFGGYGRVDDWIDGTTMVSDEYDLTNIVLSDAVENPSGLGSGTDSNRRDLLPAIDGRLSWNAVVSPDATKIVFLSVLAAGTEAPSVFVVPVTGGEPQPLATAGLTFDRPTGNSFSGFGYKVQLVDWTDGDE